MKKWLTPRNISILLIIVAVGITAYFMLRKEPLPEGLVQVNGRIEGDTVVISSKYNGKILELLAREGDDVKRGQMVVRLDDPETRSRLAQSQRNLETVTSQAKTAGQNVGLTSETGTSGIEQAQGQVNQAQSNINEAQADVRSARADIETAQATVRSATATLRQAQEAVKRYAADVETARANLASAQETVVSAQEQAKLSETNARRFTNLAREGVVTERTRDEYVTAAARDKATLQSAIANANSARAQIASRESEFRRSRDQVATARADVQRAQAQLAAARQEVGAAQARVATARGTREQAEGILREAETSPTQVTISRSQEASAQSQIREARAKVQEQKSILSSLYVTSPTTGKVVTRIRDTGEVVTAGSPILEVVDLDKLYLKAYVPENQIGKIRRGLPAKIYVDAYPDEPFDGTIRYIASSAEFTPKEVQTPDERVKLVYAVKIYIDKNPGHRLTPGMPADAIIRWKEGVPWQRPQY